jgi:hypothetical protein
MPLFLLATGWIVVVYTVRQAKIRLYRRAAQELRHLAQR